MKPRLFVLAALLLCAACFDTQNITTSVGTGPSGTGGTELSCSTLIASINVDVENGVAGGKGTVGTPLTFSADPRDGTGATIPTACLTSPATFTGSGVCPDPVGSLASFTTTPTATGTCGVTVSFLGKIGSASVAVQ